jgi:hypothetical protein
MLLKHVSSDSIERAKKKLGEEGTLPALTTERERES